jgi:hypothetical protein
MPSTVIVPPSGVKRRGRRAAALAPLLLLALACAAPRTVLAQVEGINPAPTPAEWAALGRLPDWSGVWTPNISDQNAQIKSNPPPWKPEVKKVVDRLVAEEDAGRPKGLWVDCLPHGMPGWMLKSHNAMEILFTPGRVTFLGEVDGNRLRRIYTDGRGHPADPDPSFHGHSIGHWEGDTLVVDTVGVLPQTYVAVSEAVGIPNSGDLHVIERIHLADKDVLHVDLEIFAPKILTAPWKTTRIWFRQRARKYDIAEGVCLQGYKREAIDADGFPSFVNIPQTALGNPVPPPK